MVWKETPSIPLKLILNFKFEKYALFKGEYKNQKQMFRIHAKRIRLSLQKYFL